MYVCIDAKYNILTKITFIPPLKMLLLEANKRFYGSFHAELLGAVFLAILKTE